MKVRIETGDGMNLADRDVVLERELLELIRRQIAILLLDRPELVEQGARVPLDVRCKRRQL